MYALIHFAYPRPPLLLLISDINERLHGHYVRVGCQTTLVDCVMDAQMNG